MANKIGLVTFFRDNYGSELQCYATKTFLEKNGYCCDVLFEYSYGLEKIKTRFKSVSKVALYSLIYRGFAKNRRSINQSNKLSGNSLTQESRFYLNWFCETVLRPRGVEYRLLADKRFESEYACYIAGSDQIWGGGYLVQPFMFLEFAPDEKKIALCPSFGVEEIKKFNIKQFKKSISKFRRLSVREKSGQGIISRLTGQQVPILADPVMLLDAEEWRSFAKHSEMHEEKYIFVHFLGKPSRKAVDTINHIASIKKLKVVCFANDYEEYKSLINSRFVNGSPYDYVSLIENAAYVCTDSFHTSHFSIIFNKMFLTFDRNYGHSNKQATRVQNLFSIYKCSKRFICDDIEVSDELLNCSMSFDSIRNTESANIQNYLAEALPEIIKSQPEHRLKDANECTGCMACAAICPKQAISISYSKYGYRMPSIDNEKCVNCGLCTKVCCAEITLPGYILDEAYIAYNTVTDLRFQSASGGVFSSIAKSFIELGGVVVGSNLSFEEGKVTVRHRVVKNNSDLLLLLGSKYVESDCAEVYRSIEDYLNNNISVLFCGTSCQVKALYAFLDTCRVNTERLFTIDLICHGVPGIQFFRDYLSSTIFKDQDVSDFRFRTKADGVINYQFSGKLAAGVPCANIIPAAKSSYYDLFLHCASYREQCYQCEYANDHKPGDITIGDYFEAKNDYPELFIPGGLLHDSDYLNCLLVNSDKGRQLLDRFGGYLKTNAVSRKRVQLSHPNLCKPSSYGRLRLDTMEKYQTKGFVEINRMYKRLILTNALFVNTNKLIKALKKAIIK